MIEVSVCFSWALDPGLYNTRFSSGFCIWVFILHICCGTNAKRKCWFADDLWNYESSFGVLILWSFLENNLRLNRWYITCIIHYKRTVILLQGPLLFQSDFKNLYGIMRTYTDIKNQYICISTMVPIKKRFMLQCMLGAMYKVCIMVVPSMHCSMNLFLMVTIVEIHMLNLDICGSIGNEC